LLDKEKEKEEKKEEISLLFGSKTGE